MQTTTDQFDTRAAGSMRPISWSVLMSFQKDFLPTVDFFTIGQSLIGGDDVIKGEGDVVQEWDKYDYTDYSDRVISVEWARQTDFPYTVTTAIADIVMDNHDDYFTPNAGSEVENKILPGRPVRISAGFGGENLPVFVGLTEKQVDLDHNNKTAKFHCVDFFSSLFEKPLDEAVIYQDETISFVIGELLQLAGLSALQYDLDTSFNSVSFAFFDKGEKFGDAIRKLVQADLGTMFMDEHGVIRFKNRQNFDDTSVYTFTETNINKLETKKQDDLVNVFEVKSKVREVQELQKIWESSQATLVQVGESVEVWADFQDPVTSCNDPSYSVSPSTTDSSFTTTLESTGEGTAYTDITLSDSDLFSKSLKMTFTNGGASDAYIRNVQLWGTPAKVVQELYVREQNDDSVENFGERVQTIENDYITEESTASSLALLLLNQSSEYGEIKDMEVKGTPAIQLDDQITVSLAGGSFVDTIPWGLLLSLTKTVSDVGEIGGDFAVTKTANYMGAGQYRQTLTVKPRAILDYFTIGVSTVGGGDVIAP